MQGYLKNTARKTVEAAAQETRKQAAEIKADLDQELNIFRAQVQEILDKLEKKKIEVEEMTRQSVQKNLQIPELVRQVAAIKASEKETHAQLDELKSKLQMLQATAGQGVTQAQLANVNNKYAGVLASIEKHTNNIASINKKITGIEEFELALSQKQINETHNLHDANTKIDKLEEQNTAQENKIDGILEREQLQDHNITEFYKVANEGRSRAAALEKKFEEARVDLAVLHNLGPKSAIPQKKLRHFYVEERERRKKEKEKLQRTETRTALKL